MNQHERCLKCNRRLRRRALEIGTGFCDACGHEVMATAARRARRGKKSRIEAMVRLTAQLEYARLERDEMADDVFRSRTAVVFN